MFEKEYADGTKAVVGQHVVHIEKDGKLLTNSSVDYYRDARGYGLGDDDGAVADKYHELFADLAQSPDDIAAEAMEANNKNDLVAKVSDLIDLACIAGQFYVLWQSGRVDGETLDEANEKLEIDRHEFLRSIEELSK